MYRENSDIEIYVDVLINMSKVKLQVLDKNVDDFCPPLM